MTLHSFDIEAYNTPANRRDALYAGLFVAFVANVAVFDGLVAGVDNNVVQTLTMWWTIGYYYAGANVGELMRRLYEVSVASFSSFLVLFIIKSVYYPSLGTVPYLNTTAPGMLFGAVFGTVAAATIALVIVRLIHGVSDLVSHESTAERRERILDEVLEDGDANE
jgi:hypothetical protein